MKEPDPWQQPWLTIMALTILLALIGLIGVLLCLCAFPDVQFGPP
jgi:hypothetical protein